MRRAEDDYTASELEDRWGRTQDTDHAPALIPAFDLRGLACKACCNTPGDDCLCNAPGDAEFVEAMRRVRDHGHDYRVLPGGAA